MFDNRTDAAGLYRQAGSQGNLEDASPHRLIQLLMERFLAEIAVARGHVANDQVARKGEHISHALAILGALQSSLSRDVGGEIAENLDQLYDYMSRVLLRANMRNSVADLEEVAGLMRELKSAWDAIEHAGRVQAEADADAEGRSGRSASLAVG